MDHSEPPLPHSPAPAASTDPPDPLSSLPDGILHGIIGHLPPQEKARTSILSSRWRHLWPSTPFLIFLGDDFDVPLVDRCLHLSTTRLFSLCLDLSSLPRRSTSDTLLRRWISVAARRSVSILTLYFGDIASSWKYDLPIPLFQCRYLLDLNLAGCRLRVPLNQPLPFCNNLTNLRLENVRISGGNRILHSLVSACARLEKLVLEGLSGVSYVKISNGCLEGLKVSDLPSGCLVRINDAPNLRLLSYKGELCYLFVRKNAAPLLCGVSLTSNSPDSDCFHWNAIFPDFYSRIQLLSLNFPILCNEEDSDLLPEFLAGYMPAVVQDVPFSTSYYTLRELHLCGCELDRSSVCAVLYSLSNVPLQKLCLCLAQQSHSGKVRKRKVKPLPSDLSEGMDNVETITVVRFMGSHYQKKVVDFMLRSAVALESLVLYVTEDVPRNGRLRAEILQIPRASSDARVVFSGISGDGPCPRHNMLWDSL